MNGNVKLGFIGFGEAAASISSGLKEIGVNGLSAYHYQGLNAPSGIIEKADALGVKLMESPQQLAHQCDVIFNVTRASAAKDSAFAILPYLSKRHLYVDLNSCSPGLMQEIAAFFEEQGISFLDGALMAPLPLTKHRVPIMVSGPDSNKLREQLSQIDMNIEVIEGVPGDASSIKMARSLFMKGLAALLIETYVVAKFSDEVYEKVMESMKKTWSMPLDTLLNRFLTGTIQHAGRRVGEMDHAISFVSELGMEPVITKATRTLLEKIAAKSLITEHEINEMEEGEIVSFLKEVLRKEAN